jgi:putative phosphoesterase
MRYGIFSDIHSNIEALDAVVTALKKEKVDTYLCIGDVVGYASSPKECIEIVKSLANITTAGNHDWASADLFSLDYFNAHAKEAILWTKKLLTEKDRYFLESLKLVYKNQDITLVHGTLENPEEFAYMTDECVAQETFKLMETDICFVGHTHIAGIFIKDKNEGIDYRLDAFIGIKAGNKYIVNVGSVGQPRDRNPKPAYCVYDTDKKEIHIKRVGYDIETTRKKIIDAGLPNFLGDRLLVGR